MDRLNKNSHKVMRNDIFERKDDILLWIQTNESKAFICRSLRCKPDTLNRYLRKLGISYAGNRGLKGKPVQHKLTAEEYSHTNHPKREILKRKLFQEGIKKEACEICGVSQWIGKKLPLELHHKDGNGFNNNIDNLQILCPNCHSVQDGNAGAHIGKYTAVAEQV